MSDRGLEVLSPAGNLEIFKAVVNAGADAVYFGGNQFGARAFAKNFTMEEGAEAIRYAHLHGRRAYLTLNTLLKNTEMDHKLYDYLKFYYEAGLDAVIVQDFGVFQFVKEYFPMLAIHASTQMTVTNQEGADFLMHQGASRIVTSREISLEEISKMYERSHVEIETFVHGALCVSYSGQCLMSSLIGGRSGNRGRCAQPCRLPYQVLDEQGQSIATPGPYVLSPKDLCGLHDIPALSESGVYSLKIEGRMKQLSYAAGVVSLYRKYVDLYLERGKEHFQVSSADDKKIYDLGNRCGFTNKYYYHQNGKDMITFQEPSHKKVDTPELSLPEPKIKLHGFLTAQKGKPLSFWVYKADEPNIAAQVTGDVVGHAIKQPASHDMVRSKLSKTGGTSFTFEQLELTLDSQVFLPVNQINEMRREALSEIQQQLLDKAMQPRQALDYIYMPAGSEYAAKTKAQEAEEIREVREAGEAHDVLATVETMEQLAACLTTDYITAIAIELPMYLKNQTEICEGFHKYHKKLVLNFPIIFREQARTYVLAHQEELFSSQVAYVIIHSFDAMGFLESMDYPKEKMILNYRMYTYSNKGIEAFRNLGYHRITMPVELNYKELFHLDHRDASFVVYGRTPVMVCANCMHKNCQYCDQCEQHLFLKDRFGNQFPVKNVCAYCYNVIYNSVITSLISNKSEIDSLGVRQLRLDFTLESKKETHQVLEEFRQVFIEGKDSTVDISQGYTRGHFKRGVQ